MRLLLPALLLSLLSGCYAARSAAGHAGLLWRRRSIERSIADPKTPEATRRALETVREARAFGFQTLKLKRSSDYEYWTPAPGRALTWLVSASERLRLAPRLFRFPLIGAFPYKGHFRRDLALREAAELERDGLDAAVSGSSAYNTPLWIGDPLPSPLLELPPGELAELLLHELAHGTLSLKDRQDFNEAFATWVGVRGAELFLTRRHGADSAELREWRASREREARRDALYRELRDRLEALYARGGAAEDVLRSREEVFAWARAQAKERRLPPFSEPLNNAVVLAHALYAPDLAPFDAAFERAGRDWAKTYEALRRSAP